MPGGARHRDPASPCVLQPAAHLASLVPSYQVLQHNIVEHRVSQEALQLGVLIFQRFRATGVRNIHAAKFGFELVE